MRFLVDAQLPVALCRWLHERGYEAEHVSQCLSGETPDRLIAAYAISRDLVLITKDDDFGTRHRSPQLRIVWIRLGNAANAELRLWLDARWDAIVEALNGDDTLIEVV